MKVVTIKSIANVIRVRRGYKDYLSRFINKCEIIDAIPIPEKATNGDEIKAMFPKDYTHIYDRSVSSWWNAPYKVYTK